jgi:hypothetical protein
VADKASQLVLEALGRAVADPAGMPLFSHKASPGLFAATSVARQAAARCKEQDLLRTVRTQTRGQAVEEVVTITAKGLDHLLKQSSPRQVLEDLVRALERRERQLGELVSAAQEARNSLDAMKGLAATVLKHVQSTTERVPPGLAAAILQVLGEWHAVQPSKDCPLPHLYRALDSAALPPVGAFHDSLRQLHEQGRIYLHPWTGPLYDLPEPPLALLVGHEVAYYASVRA